MSPYASKVIVVEEPPKVRGIPSLDTSVAGAIGVTERGPVGVPVLVTSFEEFELNFGGFTRDSDLALAAAGFFENGGGRLWVVRVVHYADITDADSAMATRARAELGGDPSGEGTGPSGVSFSLALEARHPGSYANHLQVEVIEGGSASSFDLLISEDGVHREVFRGLSLVREDARCVEAVLNDPRSGSQLIQVADLHEGGALTPQEITLEGGSDGLEGLDDVDFIGSDVSKTGLYALNTVQDLSTLIIPGRATPAVHNAMVAYCEQVRGGAVFAVLDPPAEMTAQRMVDYVTNTAALGGLSEHAAIYWPRVKVLNPNKTVFGLTPTITVPPSGIIAGVFTRTDASMPGGVYQPPAGIEAGRMFGVLGFETEETLEEAKRDLVYPKRINPLTTGPGLPRFIDGSRTLKGDGNFPYVAERRGVSFIERALKQGLQFARHKNNTEGLRAQVRRTITAFLITQMNNGAFRSREPSKAFFVDVSEALNTPTQIFAGRLIARVGLATNKPAEFIILQVSADVRALEAELAGSSG